MEPKTYQIVDSVEALHEAIARVRAAQKVFATYTQEQVDKIFLAAASAADKARITLAKLAVEETGMGIVEDKVIKNHYAAEYIYNAYKETKTCGVIEEDKAFGIKKIAEPIGVVTRTTDFLLLQVLFQIDVGTEGDGLEFDVFRTYAVHGTHFFLAMKIDLEVADAFQVDLSTFSQMFTHLVGQGDEYGLYIRYGQRRLFLNFLGQLVGGNTAARNDSGMVSLFVGTLRIGIAVKFIFDSHNLIDCDDVQR